MPCMRCANTCRQQILRLMRSTGGNAKTRHAATVEMPEMPCGHRHRHEVLSFVRSKDSDRRETGLNRHLLFAMRSEGLVRRKVLRLLRRRVDLSAALLIPGNTIVRRDMNDPGRPRRRFRTIAWPFLRENGRTNRTTRSAIQTARVWREREGSPQIPRTPDWPSPTLSPVPQR